MATAVPRKDSPVADSSRAAVESEARSEARSEVRSKSPTYQMLASIGCLAPGGTVPAPTASSVPAWVPPPVEARGRGVKARAGGAWTEARFNQFIRSALRAASGKWGPRCAAKRKAHVGRNQWRCSHCRQIGPATLPPKPGGKKRRPNAIVDHVEPVVDPVRGFVSWDEYIERMFCEEDGFQVLCDACHQQKTAEERTIRCQKP